MPIVTRSHCITLSLDIGSEDDLTLRQKIWDKIPAELKCTQTEDTIIFKKAIHKTDLDAILDTIDPMIVADEWELLSSLSPISALFREELLEDYLHVLVLIRDFDYKASDDSYSGDCRTEILRGLKLEDVARKSTMEQLWKALWSSRLQGDLGNDTRDFVPYPAHAAEVPLEFLIPLCSEYILAFEKLFRATGLNNEALTIYFQQGILYNPFLDAENNTIAQDPEHGFSRAGFVFAWQPVKGMTQNPSQWLKLLLFLRLQARLPTYYQDHPDFVWHFSEGGVCCISLVDVEAEMIFSISGQYPQTWALVDGFNPEIKHVDGAFYDVNMAPNPKFVVQASFPGAQCSTGWIDKALRPVDVFSPDKKYS